MSRAVITAADVESADGGELLVPAGGVVTPLARDVARERGIRLVERAGPPAASADGPSGPAGEPTAASTGAGELESRVRAVVAAVLAGEGLAEESPPASAGPRPVKLVDGSRVVMERFPFPGPGPDQQVHATDVVTSADGAPMAAGYLTLTAGSFPWTLTYDEVQIVLEGELHIGTAAGTRVGRPGDVLYVPKGSQITFGTPTWARFVYVTFPADWAG